LGAASSLTSQQRSVLNIQETPTIQSAFNTVAFSSLPGIREVLNGSETMESLSNFILSRVAYVPDSSDRLDKAKSAYMALDGSQYTDCALLISTEETLFQACSVWKGAEFKDALDRAEHFILICPALVQIDYAEADIDINNTDWSGFIKHIHSIWRKAFSKQRNLLRFKQTQHNFDVPKTVPRLMQPSRSRDQDDCVANSDGFKDYCITCRDCSIEFVFTASNQQYHKEKGYTNTPSRCKECKTIHMTSMGQTPIDQKNLPCYQFSAGECSFGNRCKFMHENQLQARVPTGSKTVNVAIVADTAEDSDDYEGFEIKRPGSWADFVRP
jgi:hypothetical protein